MGRRLLGHVPHFRPRQPGAHAVPMDKGGLVAGQHPFCTEKKPLLTILYLYLV